MPFHRTERKVQFRRNLGGYRRSWPVYLDGGASCAQQFRRFFTRVAVCKRIFPENRSGFDHALFQQNPKHNAGKNNRARKKDPVRILFINEGGLAIYGGVENSGAAILLKSISYFTGFVNQPAGRSQYFFEIFSVSLDFPPIL